MLDGMTPVDKVPSKHTIFLALVRKIVPFDPLMIHREKRLSIDRTFVVRRIMCRNQSMADLVSVTIVFNLHSNLQCTSKHFDYL